jgi:pimeloyl-ACP methyl ester carboxylesterase
MSARLRPIIYIRGFAATEAEIDDTVATPYMGFNTGSTRVRQSYGGKMVPFVFESPLVRLMKDFGYEDCFSKGDFRDVAEAAEGSPEASVWIFRYDEQGDNVSSVGQRKSIEDFAADLRDFIERVKESVVRRDPAAANDFKVYLVAHSMGGLIARSYLQRHCPTVMGGADPMVDKVFTYGTPHRGIDMMGVNVPDLSPLDPFDVGNFNHKRMREYLDLPKDAPVNSLGHQDKNTPKPLFPPERFFSFIGTNHKDYDAFFGLSKRGTGAMSDGLVMMKNAYVGGGPRGYAHRSHSGKYGLVNSEEGFQNLTRFLFGQTRVDVLLHVDQLTLPPKLEERRQECKERG